MSKAMQDEQEPTITDSSNLLEQKISSLSKKVVAEEEQDLPQDVYSILLVTKSWWNVRIPCPSLPFLFAIGVFAFQTLCLIFVIVDLLDAPEEAPKYNVPAGVSGIVRASQFCALIIAIVTQNDVVTSVATLSDRNMWEALVEGRLGQEEAQEQERAELTQILQVENQDNQEEDQSATVLDDDDEKQELNKQQEGQEAAREIGHVEYHRRRRKIRFVLANVLRLVEGLIGLYVSMIIIVQSFRVIDLFKDFAALAFISILDDSAFFLACHGFFFKTLQEEALQVKNQKIKSRIDSNVCSKNLACRFVTIFILFLGMTGMWMNYAVTPQINGEYLPKSITIQFGDDLAVWVASFSGVYDLGDVSSKHGGRFIYEERNKNGLGGPALFYYCLQEKRWVFLSTSSQFKKECFPASALSPQSESYNLLDVPSTGWSIWGGTDWRQMQHFSIFSNDCSTNNTCNSLGDNGWCFEKACDCNEGYYGPRCQFKGPCRLLEADNGRGFDNYANSYTLLLQNRTNNTSWVETYGQPVYIHSYGDDKEFDALVFAGRHWVSFYTENAGLEGWNHTEEWLINYFTNFHGNSDDGFWENAWYISDPTTGGAPFGLKWYKWRAGVQQAFGADRLKEETSTLLICCDCTFSQTTSFGEIEDPCLFDGYCNSTSGKCECAHGMSGAYCHLGPVEGFVAMTLELDSNTNSCASCEKVDFWMDFSEDNRWWFPYNDSSYETLAVPNMTFELFNETKTFQVSFGDQYNETMPVEKGVTQHIKRIYELLLINNTIHAVEEDQINCATYKTIDRDACTVSGEAMREQITKNSDSSRLWVRLEVDINGAND